MNATLRKLEKLNKTMEDGLARVERAKSNGKPGPKKALKATATALLAAPLAWAGFVLGALAAYGLARGAGVCLKFLGAD